MSTTQRRLSWIAQILAALILGQTLFFKFSGAPESRFIFETLGAEPWGRIGSAIVELLAVILLLSGRFAAVGGVLALGTMTGAIGAHLTKLGVEVQGDGGMLFGLAIVTLLAAVLIVWLRRRELPVVGALLRPSTRPEQALS